MAFINRRIKSHMSPAEIIDHADGLLARHGSAIRDLVAGGMCPIAALVAAARYEQSLIEAVQGDAVAKARALDAVWTAARSSR